MPGFNAGRFDLDGKVIAMIYFSLPRGWAATTCSEEITSYDTKMGRDWSGSRMVLGLAALGHSTSEVGAALVQGITEVLNGSLLDADT